MDKVEDDLVKAKQLIIELRLKKNRLPSKSFKIADYLLENWKHPEDIKLDRIKEKTGSSGAAVVKLCKSLGFNGIKELKQVLTTLAISNPKDLYDDLTANDSPPEIIDKVFLNSLQSLEDTLAVLKKEDVIKAAEFILRADSVDFFGVGGSASIAADAFHKFFKIGYRVNCFSDSHLQAMSASMFNEKNVCIAISHSGRTRAIVESLKIARQQKAKIISITNVRTSPISTLADVALYSAARDVPLTGENATARICQLAIVDAIFNIVCTRKYDNAISMLTKTQMALEFERI